VCILSREAGMRLLRCSCVAGSLRYTKYTSLADALLQSQKSHTVSREKNKMHTTVSHASSAFSRTRRGNCGKAFEVVSSACVMMLYSRW